MNLNPGTVLGPVFHFLDETIADYGVYLYLALVCRIGTHLFHFAEYVNAMRGWGRGLRNAVGRWYVDRGADDLAHQAVKYQQRDGWSHGDLLRLAHPKAPSAQHDAVFRWMLAGADSLGEREVKRKVRGEDRVAKYGAVGELPKLVQAFEQAKRASIAGEIVKLIDEFDLPREAIPTQWLNEAVVWEALLEHMPMTAMIRNLGKMTSLGLLAPFSDAKRLIVRKLRDETALKRARIHPLAILVAQKIYAQGHGDKGALKWSPVSAVVDALDEAFYATFQNVEPCGKPVLLALDVSGSMAGSMIAGWHEVDVLAVANGQFVIGEVKEGYVQKTAFDELAEIAEVLHPQRAIIFLSFEHAKKQWPELNEWLRETQARLAPKNISFELFTLPEY